MSNSTFLKAMGKKNTARRYVGGGPRPDNTEFKRTEARERAVQWNKLSPREQLAALDVRLGLGKGATRQRARIAAKLAQAKPAVTEQVPTGAERLKAKERRAKERQKH